MRCNKASTCRQFRGVFELQDLLGFRLDEAVEREKGAASGFVSLSRPTSVASDLHLNST